MANEAKYSILTTLTDVFDSTIVLRADFFTPESPEQEFTDKELGTRTKLYRRIIGDVVKHGNRDEELVRADNGECVGLTFDALMAVRSRMEASLSMGIYEHINEQGVQKVKGTSKTNLEMLDAIISGSDPAGD